MSLQTIPVEKLRGRENYATWKFAMQAWLQLDDLWEVVSGTKIDETKDRKALSKIVLCLETINYCHVQNSKTSKEAWKSLEEAFEDSGLTRRVGLLRKLITTRLENCKSVEKYVDEITSTAHKLNEIGFTVGDAWVGTLLLAGLPDHYRPMIMGLESSGTKITGDAVKVKLLQDVQVADVAKNNDSESAMYANKYQKRKDPPKCFVCQKIGHIAAQCRYKNKQGGKSVKDNSKTKRAFVASENSDIKYDTEWYIDSGASNHIVKNKNLIRDPIKKTDVSIVAANNTNFKSQSIGTAEIQISNGYENTTVEVKETLYIPEATANLLSVSKIVKNGHSVHFTSEGGQIMNENGDVIGTATEINGIYKLNQPTTKSAYLSKENCDGILWHRRLGHLNRKGLSLLRKMSTGMSKNFINEKICEDCIIGKQQREPFNVSKKQSKDILELIHTDLCGPMEQTSIGGSKYFLTFIDDFSRYLHVYILDSKDQVTETFIDFKNMIEKQTGKKIKKIRSDNGKEYLNEKLKKMLKNEGIVHQLTVRYTPQQNGVAERMNRSIVEKARTLLSDAKLNKEYWAEAVATAAYLLNRSPTKRLWNKTPYEAFKGEKPDLSHLRVFGCEAMAQIPKELRKKWDPKSQKLLMMGYSETRKAYRLINPINKKIIFSRDVKFLEYAKQNTEQKPTEEKKEEMVIDFEEKKEKPDSDIEDDEWCETFSEEQNEMEEVETTRSGRIINKPAKMKDYVTYLTLNEDQMETNVNTVEEVMSEPNSEEWKIAMRKEMEALKKNDVYEVTDLPAGKKPLSTKWVFKEKADKEGMKKYKARLVIKGCNQKYGIDYQETFSPVVKYTSLRYLFSLAASRNLRIDHMDVMTAYLNGDIEEEIYVKPPINLDGKVWRLKKAVYGLKQSGRCWNNKLNNVLVNFGLTKCKSDPCIYSYKHCSGQILIVAIYVDDLLIFSNNKKLRENLKKNLMSNFEMKDLGIAKQCLGMKITRDIINKKLFIDQKEYTEKILKKFNMSECKPVDTPLEKGINFNPCEKQNKCNVPYQEAVGSLLYLSMISRPDIAFAVSLLSRYNNNYTVVHWNAIKRVFRYLKGTLNYKLEFNPDNSCNAYSDADWGNSLNNRYSVTGSCIKVNGCLISWFSKKQKTVALSTMEAEYMALSSTVQECIWLKQLIEEIAVDNYNMVKIHCDNMGAIDMSKNYITSQRAKHIDIRHHFIRDCVDNKDVEVVYLNTEAMPADALTKQLSKEKHNMCVKFFGLCPI